MRQRKLCSRRLRLRNLWFRVGLYPHLKRYVFRNYRVPLAPSSKFLKHFVFRTRSVWLYFYYVYFYYDIPQHKGSFCWYTVFIEKWAYLAASLMLSVRAGWQLEGKAFRFNTELCCYPAGWWNHPTLKVYNPHYRVGQSLRPSFIYYTLLYNVTRVHSLFLLFLCPPV